MIYWFYRNKIAALFGIDRVGKILTEEHSKTHGIHIDGIYQQNGKINISKERMNTGWL